MTRRHYRLRRVLLVIPMMKGRVAVCAVRSAGCRIAIAALCMLCHSYQSHANSYNGTQQVLSVDIHDSGRVLILLANAANTEGCATAPTNYVVLDKNSLRFKEMYAMALLAVATGKLVSAWVNGCTDLWGNGANYKVTVTTLAVAP